MLVYYYVCLSIIVYACVCLSMLVYDCVCLCMIVNAYVCLCMPLYTCVCLRLDWIHLTMSSNTPVSMIDRSTISCIKRNFTQT